MLVVSRHSPAIFSARAVTVHVADTISYMDAAVELCQLGIPEECFS